MIVFCKTNLKYKSVLGCFSGGALRRMAPVVRGTFARRIADSERWKWGIYGFAYRFDINLRSTPVDIRIGSHRSGRRRCRRVHMVRPSIRRYLRVHEWKIVEDWTVENRPASTACNNNSISHSEHKRMQKHEQSHHSPSLWCSQMIIRNVQWCISPCKRSTISFISCLHADDPPIRHSAAS